MHKQLSADELAVIERDHPVPKRTKSEQLNQWADLIDAQVCNLYLYSNLENWGSDALDNPKYVDCGYPTAISLALGHEAFKAEGIGNSVGSALKFFELSKTELHSFSCDCGG